MDALINAFGNLPKWFTFIILACIAALLLLSTYSVGRTILYDCGSINVAGTKFGGHCVMTGFVSTTVWDRIDLGPPEDSESTEGGSVSRCATVINRSSLSNPDNYTSRDFAADFDIFWFKRPYGDGLYDVVLQCQDNTIQVMVTSSASWPANRFLDDAMEALRTSASAAKSSESDTQ